MGGVRNENAYARKEKDMFYFSEFSTLIWMLEEFFDNKRFALNMERMKHLQKHGLSGLELDDYENPEVRDILNKDENIDIEMDLGILESMGIQIFRNYFFVAIYQHFEDILIGFCTKSEDKQDQIGFKDIYGKNCIDKCKTYLTKVAKIKIPPEILWQKISTYNKLRNTIIHNNSIIDSSQRGEELRKFAKGHPLLYLYNDIYEDNKELLEYGEISPGVENFDLILEKGFCEEAIDDFDLFLTDLKEQIENESRNI